MRVVAAVQVRMGSSRLPGKPLIPVAGKPLLEHLVDRLAMCRELDHIVIATSTKPENDVIEKFCTEKGVQFFRGSENDVLGRMLGALTDCDATVGVEVFGDCPLIDPFIVDDMIRLFKHQPDLDWLGNDLMTSYPPGMEVEVFRVSALADSERRVEEPSVREHGTLYIRQNPGRYKIRNIEAEGKLRRPDLSLELDTEEDLIVITEVLRFFNECPGFTAEDIIDFMDARPELKRVNISVPRRWKKFRQDDMSRGGFD